MMPSKITVKRTVTARNRRFCRNRCGLSMVLLKWRTPDEIAGPHYSCDGCCDAEPQEGYKTGSGAASRKKGENECRDHVGARESYAGQARCKLLDVRRDADDQQQQQDSGQYLRLAEVRQKELSLIHISEPTRLGMISYAVFCLKKKNGSQHNIQNFSAPGHCTKSLPDRIRY